MFRLYIIDATRIPSIYANHTIDKCHDLTLDYISILEVMSFETIPKHSTNSSDGSSTSNFLPTNWKCAGSLVHVKHVHIRSQTCINTGMCYLDSKNSCSR